MIEYFHSRIHYTRWIAFFFRTLYENTLSCEVILVARQRICCICSYSNVNNGKEGDKTLLMHWQPRWCRMPEYFHVMFCHWVNESVNESILSCFSHYLWINPYILWNKFTLLATYIMLSYLFYDAFKQFLHYHNAIQKKHGNCLAGNIYRYFR